MGDAKKWEDGGSEEEAKKEQHRLLWTTSSFRFTSSVKWLQQQRSGFTTAGVFVGRRTRRQCRFLLLLSVLFSVTFIFGFWTFQSDEWSSFSPPYHKLEQFGQ
ncbi:hypothetical protein niasHS_001892 [Heterodera schachtii]|uniref:Uncharacterized protein n=1 Tax=Heterodera schachtii TaxID=97005 RepID=A0ABD2KAS8_HETSC